MFLPLILFSFWTFVYAILHEFNYSFLTQSEKGASDVLTTHSFGKKGLFEEEEVEYSFTATTSDLLGGKNETTSFACSFLPL